MPLEEKPGNAARLRYELYADYPINQRNSNQSEYTRIYLSGPVSMAEILLLCGL